MLTATYRAVLKGNQLEWWGDDPPELARGLTVQVDVKILPDEGLSAWRAPNAGEKMAEALDKLAAIGTGSEISDPVAWQREVRRERRLPGRD